MDTRFGDPSISAPTQGSWNEMPYLRPGMADFATLPNRVSRIKTCLRPDVVESSEFSGGTDNINFPRHPLVDMQTRKRSISVDRTKKQNDRQRSLSRTRQSPSPKARHRASCESPSCSERDEEERQEAVHSKTKTEPQYANRNGSREDCWRAQSRGTKRDSQQSSIQHKSPPLSATAVMRRYSSQSESTRTYSSTPSTATFRSSITTPGLHGFSASSIPPLLREEGYAAMFDKDAPPVPPIPKDRNGSMSTSSSPHSASRSVFREQHRTGNSNNKRHIRPVGPQEMVPSNDELWGLFAFLGGPFPYDMTFLPFLYSKLVINDS
ncbi:hypothetical protein TSTA_015110 [Talaromyces stipitatus ATCC 10500]|uniref:Uncharacterized protein n=1 Tax=Talaromyces stipitatus (strain ATCC 10500 / CBS 375.48 / QM 6759 / NRRL 1006) TaxID=441959 RepID=B8MHU1_TALSN|nr:uncharacterized protein TSTA_015110 [Talaromyces stipitatus ATCC 10500]EED16421.1 hypothetical protein TSTA_015110 [Talaromyces stipitatus ATCC 10500]